MAAIDCASSCKNAISTNKAVSDKIDIVELNFKGREFKYYFESLLDILKNYNINLNQIGIIKIDIEGEEFCSTVKP